MSDRTVLARRIARDFASHVPTTGTRGPKTSWWANTTREEFRAAHEEQSKRMRGEAVVVPFHLPGGEGRL